MSRITILNVRRESWRGGLALVVLAGLLLFLILPREMYGSNDRQAVTTSAQASERPTWLRPLSEATTRDASHLPSGEPGVLDVQAWDWLNQDLERLVDRTRTNARQRLSPDAFKAQFLGATTAFLEFDDEARRAFESAVAKALREIGSAREHLLRQQIHTASASEKTGAMDRQRAAWTQFSAAQRHAKHVPVAVLDARPRHQLLREAMLKWLLRLDYGHRAASR